MENFAYFNPTKIIFGQKTEETVGKEIAVYGKKVLLHYGGGSIKSTGLYDRVVQSLTAAGLEIFELGGVAPNPRLSMVRIGIDLVRKHGIDAIVAVGGGSVIDSAKGIRLGASYQGDVWDYYIGKANNPGALIPLGVILTIPAAGSESSVSSVITNEEGLIKRSFRHDALRPNFAIMNPELTYTIPPYHQTAGIVDIFSHVLERYFTNATHVDLTDELCEGVFRAIVKNGYNNYKHPGNYDYAAEVMWTSTIAHNGILDTGRIADWASHMIEHELSALYDLSHGRGLAIIVPAWMTYVYKHDVARFARFANKVFDVPVSANLEEMAKAGIVQTRAFFESLGIPTTLTAAKLPTDQFALMAKKAAKGATVGQFVKLTEGDIYKIYELAV